MFLEEFFVLHIMSSKSRYSVGGNVNSTSIPNAVDAFEST